MATALRLGDRPAVSARWITGPAYDLLWYVGSCLTGYLLVVLHLGLGVPALLLWWAWIVTVDGPHVFGTISRTYLDREEWARRRGLLLGSLGWFAAGPLAAALVVATASPVPLDVFFVLAQLWAYWHVVRQHYGFLVLYQRKNGEAAGRANRIDAACFYAVLLAPFASFLLRHPAARDQLGLPAAPSSLDASLVGALDALVLLAVAVYAGKEIARVLRGEPWNLPKNALLAAVVPLHLLVFRHPVVSTKADIALFAAFVTAYHNLQYHGIVWFHNRNRYGGDPAGERFGWASLVSRRFLLYYAAGIVFTVAYRYPNWILAGIPAPLTPPPAPWTAATLAPGLPVSGLVAAFFWGFALHHYYLDQKIWKVSRDERLRRELGLEGGSSR